MAHAEKFLALVNDAKKRIRETNVADVKRRMDAGEKFVLVDVREESEWAQGHLPGAIQSRRRPALRRRPARLADHRRQGRQRELCSQR